MADQRPFRHRRRHLGRERSIQRHRRPLPGQRGQRAGVAVAVQSADNAEIEADAHVRADLGLSQVITAPITTTPRPAPSDRSATLHDFTDDELAVTVSQIYDPATAANGSGLPDAGTRFVAVEMSLADVTGGSIAGDANYSTTVVGTDGKTYTADIGGVVGVHELHRRYLPDRGHRYDDQRLCRLRTSDSVSVRR